MKNFLNIEKNSPHPLEFPLLAGQQRPWMPLRDHGDEVVAVISEIAIFPINMALRCWWLYDWHSYIHAPSLSISGNVVQLTPWIQINAFPSSGTSTATSVLSSTRQLPVNLQSWLLFAAASPSLIHAIVKFMLPQRALSYTSPFLQCINTSASRSTQITALMFINLIPTTKRPSDAGPFRERS